MIKKVLLVEDSTTDAYYIKNILDSNGFSVTHVTNTEDAIVKLHQHIIDLILLDIVLPTSSGFAFVRQLSKGKQFSHIPVIICSHKSEESDKIWAIKQGALDYLVKPISEEILVSRINNLYVF